MNTLRRWHKQLTSDRRKLGLVIGLALVGLLLWGRLMVNQLPQSASAEQADSGPPPMPELASLQLREAPGEASEQPAVRLALPDTLPRDLFDLAALMPEEKLTDPAKSPDKSADAPNKPIDLSGLTLQSVMRGSGRRAMINGQIVRVGETIQGFTLKRVADRTVVLEKHGRLFRLAL
jgi:hypothetical protein